MVVAELQLGPRRSEQPWSSKTRATALRFGLLLGLVGTVLGAPESARAFVILDDEDDEPPPPPPPSSGSSSSGSTGTGGTSGTGSATSTPSSSGTSGSPTTTTSTTTSSTATRSAASGPTETALDEDNTSTGRDRGDRFRLFYIEVSGGFSWVKLGLMRENNLIPELVRIDESGYAVSVGAGFYVSFLTLGVQSELAFHDSFSLGTVMLDLGIRLPTRSLEPYLRVGIGYAWLFDNDLIPGQSLTIRGVAANLGVGFDYMITPLLAIGIGADATVLNVRRSGVSGAGSSFGIDLSEEGDALGLQITALAQISLHF